MGAFMASKCERKEGKTIRCFVWKGILERRRPVGRKSLSAPLTQLYLLFKIIFENFKNFEIVIFIKKIINVNFITTFKLIKLLNNFKKYN